MTSTRRWSSTFLALATLASSAAHAAGVRDVVIEPGPERAGAVAAGKDTVARAQGLARQGDLAEAVALLEELAVTWPSATHDCNLSLAYLRAKQLTRAYVWWDLAALRNSERPEWCTSTLTQQLTEAVRAAGFVPLSLHVNPADAVVSLEGLKLRGIPVVWVAPGPLSFLVEAPEHVSARVRTTVTAPQSRASVSLEKVAANVDLSTPPTQTPGDAPTSQPTDAAADLPSIAELDAALAPARPRWPAWAAFGLGGVALAVGVQAHLAALDARDQGNGVLTTDPRFDDAKRDFGAARTRALIGYGVAGAAAGFGVWWLMRGDGASAEAPAVGASVDGDGAAVTVGGAW